MAFRNYISVFTIIFIVSEGEENQHAKSYHGHKRCEKWLS